MALEIQEIVRALRVDAAAERPAQDVGYYSFLKLLDAGPKLLVAQIQAPSAPGAAERAATAALSLAITAAKQKQFVIRKVEYSGARSLECREGAVLRGD